MNHWAVWKDGDLYAIESSEDFINGTNVINFKEKKAWAVIIANESLRTIRVLHNKDEPVNLNTQWQLDEKKRLFKSMPLRVMESREKKVPNMMSIGIDKTQLPEITRYAAKHDITIAGVYDPFTVGREALARAAGVHTRWDDKDEDGKAIRANEVEFVVWFSGLQVFVDIHEIDGYVHHVPLDINKDWANALSSLMFQFERQIGCTFSNARINVRMVTPEQNGYTLEALSAGLKQKHSFSEVEIIKVKNASASLEELALVTQVQMPVMNEMDFWMQRPIESKEIVKLSVSFLASVALGVAVTVIANQNTLAELKKSNDSVTKFDDNIALTRKISSNENKRATLMSDKRAFRMALNQREQDFHRMSQTLSKLNRLPFQSNGTQLESLTMNWMGPQPVFIATGSSESQAHLVEATRHLSQLLGLGSGGALFSGYQQGQWRFEIKEPLALPIIKETTPTGVSGPPGTPKIVGSATAVANESKDILVGQPINPVRQ